jgi:hypothetical protein
MTDDGNEQVPEQKEPSDTRRLRRDLVLGAAVVFVLFLIFRHHDSTGNGTPTPSPTPTTSTTTADLDD